jgi:glyoxylase-like metal-dependent hydrolase (beta-lactamase superfamily II)
LPEIKAVATPGHTPGHSAYEISSNGEKLLYVGDIVHHYVLSVQHPDWSIAFDQDAAAAQAVRQKTLADATFASRATSSSGSRSNRLAVVFGL